MQVTSHLISVGRMVSGTSKHHLGVIHVVMVYSCSVTYCYVICNYIVFGVFNNLKTKIVKKSLVYVRQKLVIS